MESIKGNLQEAVKRLSSLKVSSEISPQVQSLVVYEGSL